MRKVLVPTTTKSFMRLFQLVLRRPSSEPGMSSSEPDPLSVRIDNEDILRISPESEVAVSLLVKKLL